MQLTVQFLEPLILRLQLGVKGFDILVNLGRTAAAAYAGLGPGSARIEDQRVPYMRSPASPSPGTM